MKKSKSWPKCICGNKNENRNIIKFLNFTNDREHGKGEKKIIIHLMKNRQTAIKWQPLNVWIKKIKERI